MAFVYGIGFNLCEFGVFCNVNGSFVLNNEFCIWYWKRTVREKRPRINFAAIPYIVNVDSGLLQQMQNFEKEKDKGIIGWLCFIYTLGIYIWFWWK